MLATVNPMDLLIMVIILLGTGILDIIVQGLMYLGLVAAFLWEHLDEVDPTDL